MVLVALLGVPSRAADPQNAESELQKPGIFHKDLGDNVNSPGFKTRCISSRNNELERARKDRTSVLCGSVEHKMPSTRSKESDAPRLRRRPATSCEPCRARKLRCDRALPCSRCKRARTSIDCFYREHAPGKGKQTSNNQLSPLDEATGDSSLVTQPARPAFHAQGLATPSSHTSPKNHGRLEPLEDRVQRLEALLNVRHGRHDAGDGILDTTIAPRASCYDASREVPQLRHSPDKVRLFGRSHWMGLGRILVSFCYFPRLWAQADHHIPSQLLLGVLTRRIYILHWMTMSTTFLKSWK